MSDIEDTKKQLDELLERVQPFISNQNLQALEIAYLMRLQVELQILDMVYQNKIVQQISNLDETSRTRIISELEIDISQTYKELNSICGALTNYKK